MAWQSSSAFQSCRRLQVESVSPSHSRLVFSSTVEISRRSQITSSPMEESDAVQKPVVVDPPLYNEAPSFPEAAQRRPVVITADRDRPIDLVQRIQRALAELRELRNQFNAILREIELEVGGEEEQAESSVEDPEDDSDS